MSIVILPAPPIDVTVTRATFYDKEDPTKTVFLGTCSDVPNPMQIIWDTYKTEMSEASIKLLESIELHQRVEISGKWSTYVNLKTGKPTISFLLEKVKPEDPSKKSVPRLKIPTEKRFNFEETEDALTLKKLTYQSEIAKLERRSGKIVKSQKLTTAVDDDDREPEEPTDQRRKGHQGGSRDPPSDGTNSAPDKGKDVTSILDTFTGKHTVFSDVDEDM